MHSHTKTIESKTHRIRYVLEIYIKKKKSIIKEMNILFEKQQKPFQKSTQCQELDSLYILV